MAEVRCSARSSATGSSSIAEAQEPIVEVAVREGDAVKSGDLVLRLDPADREARLAQARAQRTKPSSASRNRGRRSQGAGARGARARRWRFGANRGRVEEFERVEKLVGQKLLPASELDRQRALKRHRDCE